MKDLGATDTAMVKTYVRHRLVQHVVVGRLPSEPDLYRVCVEVVENPVDVDSDSFRLLLETTRGEVRRFKSLDAAVRVVRECGWRGRLSVEEWGPE